MSYNHMVENQIIALTVQEAQEMYELVMAKNGRAVTSSLIVARYFKKQHKAVLRAINALDCSDNFRAANFGVSCYTKTNGNVTKSYPMYYMTRDGFTFLAMGFTGRVAAQFKENYIRAFNEMEEALRKDSGMRYAEQLEEQRPAVRLAPDYLQLKSRLEAGLGRPRSAARLLELARSLAPEDEELRAEIALELGRFYAGRGETAAAIAAWKEVLDAAPRSRSAVTAARLLKEIRQKEVER